MAYKNKTIIFNQENNFIGVTTLVLIFEKSKFYVVFYMYRIFFIHFYLINKSKKNRHRLKIKIEHQLWRKGLRAQILFFDCRFFFWSKSRHSESLLGDFLLLDENIRERKKSLRVLRPDRPFLQMTPQFLFSIIVLNQKLFYNQKQCVNWIKDIKIIIWTNADINYRS